MAALDADGNSKVNMSLRSFGEVHCAMIFFVMLQLIVAEVHGAAAETSTSSHDDDHTTHADDDHSSSHAGDDHHDGHHNLFTLGSDLDAKKVGILLRDQSLLSMDHPLMSVVASCFRNTPNVGRNSTVYSRPSFHRDPSIFAQRQ